MTEQSGNSDLPLEQWGTEGNAFAFILHTFILTKILILNSINFIIDK